LLHPCACPTAKISVFLPGLLTPGPVLARPKLAAAAFFFYFF
jgi:hypothetical protein